MQGTIGFTGTLSGQIDDSGSGGTSNYNELTNKPSINSVPLVGNKTTEDLHLFTGDYDDLNDKPSINGITLSGNKTTADLGLFSGNYNDLTNKPILFSGDYNDLTNKPTLFSGDYNDLTNKPTLFDGDYDSLTDRPTINNVVLTGNKNTADLGLFSGNYNDLTNKPTLFDGDYDSLSSRPQINGNLLTGNKTTADLGLFSGNYNDLTNKPTIPEIDMSPSGAATEEMVDIEVDGTVYEVVDSAARGIIGDGQLDPGFTATDLTGAANELKSNLTELGTAESKIFKNAQTIVFNLKNAPSGDKVAQALMFNANQGICAIVRMDTALSVTNILGSMGWTISNSGATITITPSSRLWGATSVIVDEIN